MSGTANVEIGARTVLFGSETFPLAVHPSGRYLVTAQGVPYRLQSEFCWQAWTTLTLSEFITYLDDRKAKGFNAFEAWIIDRTSGGTAVNNSRGDAPFTTVDNLSTPNETYFQYVDQFLEAAEARGMSPMLYYTYAGYSGNTWWPVVGSNSLANCQSWGTFLGNRYKHLKTLIWMSGGDYTLPNDSTRTKYVAILTAIRAAGAYQIAGAEWGDPDTLVSDQGGYTYGINPATSDMQLDSFYCEGPTEGGGTGNGRDYDTADRSWRRTSPVMPSFPCETPQCDGTYYPIDMSRPSTRKYWHWAITAGGIAGVNIGQTNVANPSNSTDFFNHWHDPYITDGQHSVDLFKSIRWWDMRPSGTASSSPHTRSGATGSTAYCGRVLIVSGGGSGDSLITSCMSRDGTQLLAYVPSTGTGTTTFSVDLRSMSGTCIAYWWNPLTGAMTTISAFPNSLSSVSFTTPSASGRADSSNDWMLVCKVAPVEYSTDFRGSETPLSEGGYWRNNGLDWTNVVKAGGIAYGTQTGSNGFDDSYAILSGVGMSYDQSVSVVIHKASGTSSYQETEILLRWVDDAHHSYGYECNLAHDGQYAEIIKWPTAGKGTTSGDFSWVSSGNPVAAGVHDGDIFQADIIGNVITVRLNGQVIATGTDSSFTAGSPGIGFYSEGAAAGNKYGFTHFEAISLGPPMLKYGTTFSGGTENPISERKAWTTGSPYQPACQMGSGLCWGNQTGDEKFIPIYNDSQAFLSGFPKNHGCELTISLTGTPVGDLEVELLLGAKFGPVRHVGTNPGDTAYNDTDFDGIEINLLQGKYGILGYVARFLDGTNIYDDFSGAFQAHGVHDGDKLRAQLIVDDTAQTGVVMVWMVRATTGVVTLIGKTPARSNYYRIGNPGIGFYRENNSPGVQDDPKIFSATAFSAWGLP